MSQLYYFSSSTGADESQYYIKRLALALRTSDGNHGPSPGFRVTHWSWRGPNMVRQKRSPKKHEGFLSLEKAVSTDGCATLCSQNRTLVVCRAPSGENTPVSSLARFFFPFLPPTCTLLFLALLRHKPVETRELASYMQGRGVNVDVE